MRIGVGEYRFSVQIWTFHSILSKELFWKKTHTSIPPVSGEGLENIAFLNRYRHIMQLFVN